MSNFSASDVQNCFLPQEAYPYFFGVRYIHAVFLYRSSTLSNDVYSIPVFDGPAQRNARTNDMNNIMRVDLFDYFSYSATVLAKGGGGM